MVANIRVNRVNVRVQEALVSADGKEVTVTHLNGDTEIFGLKDKTKAEIKALPYPKGNEAVLDFVIDEEVKASDFNKNALVYPALLAEEKAAEKEAEKEPEKEPVVIKTQPVVATPRPPFQPLKDEEKKD